MSVGVATYKSWSSLYLKHYKDNFYCLMTCFKLDKGTLIVALLAFKANKAPIIVLYLKPKLVIQTKLPLYVI